MLVTCCWPVRVCSFCRVEYQAEVAPLTRRLLLTVVTLLLMF
jgi:hypothetical protein